MNNTKYLAMSSEFLPLDRDKLHTSQFTSFIHQILIKHLLCDGHLACSWEYKSKHNKYENFPYGAYANKSGVKRNRAQERVT